MTEKTIPRPPRAPMPASAGAWVGPTGPLGRVILVIAEKNAT